MATVLSIIQGSSVRVTQGTLLNSATNGTFAARLYNALNEGRNVLALVHPITEEFATALLEADGTDNTRVMRDTSVYSGRSKADKGKPRVAEHVAKALDRFNTLNPVKADKLGPAVYGGELRDDNGAIVAFWVYSSDDAKAQHEAAMTSADNDDNAEEPGDN